MNCPICQTPCVHPTYSGYDAKEAGILRCGDGKTHFFYYHPNVCIHMSFYKENASELLNPITISFEQHSSISASYGVIVNNAKWVVKLPGEQIITCGTIPLSPIEACHILTRCKEVMVFS